jgi:salicylate hydroxylase
VVAVDPEEPSVTLANGEVLRADVLVGADGEYGIGRETFLGPAEHDPGQYLMFKCVNPFTDAQ